MASSYTSQHQHPWDQRPMAYVQGELPENGYGFTTLPASSNDFTYAPPSGSPDVGQSAPVTNPGYAQTHIPQYGNTAPKQPVPSSAASYFNDYNSPPTRNEEIYNNGYPKQPLSAPADFGPFNNQNNVQIPVQGLGDLAIAEGNSRMDYVNGPTTQEQYLHPTNVHLPYQFTSPGGPNAKRQRENPDEQEAELIGTGEGAKPKLGACNRCKSLKVKCEFKTETDPCKRCLNGGHDCFIPGRKKRRAPPKREVLLNQIREQAAQIQSLMSQLETTNKSTTDRSSTPDLLSPLASSVYAPSSNGSGSRTPEQTKEAVTAWIAKAKESLGEFDEHINMAGANMPRDLLAGSEQEADDEDDGYYTAFEEDDDDVGIAVERPDGEDQNDDMSSPDKTMNRKDSESSLNSTKKSGNKKGATIPTKAAPFGLLGEMSLNKYRGSNIDSEDSEDKDNTGIANDNYFRSVSTPTSLCHRLSDPQNVPQIISRGLITPAEAEALFKIYFDNINLSVSLLDPVLYTAPNTFIRSPFLFTVICAISSRFYSKRPDLFQQAMRLAQSAAGQALISGKKDVEMCHGYILLSLYPVPAKRWEDQRSWLYLGLAIRVATELNLHLPVTNIPQEEKPAREVLNRARLWLNCFDLDRSTGAQYGKPPTINSIDYQANHSQDWWRSSPYNMRNFDIHLCCYNHELRTTANFISKIYGDPENPTGLNEKADFEKVAAETDDELQRLREQWFKVMKENTDPDNYAGKFRMCLLKLVYSYGRLVVLSYGFQHAFGKNNTDENPFLTRCLNAAEDVIQAVINDICGDDKMREFWRHGPEAQSVFVTFAAAFLVKLLQPKFASYLTYEKRVDIQKKVQQAVDMLSSIAVDNSHGPRLYAKFLKGLLASPMARLDFQSPATSISSLPRNRAGRKVRSSANPGSPGPNVSPKGRSSMSPPPHQDADSFESFAPLRGASDPYAFGTDAGANVHNAMGLDISSMSDLFNPPLSIDKQIIDNMNTIGEAASWNSYNWLSHYQALQQNLGMDLRSSANDIMQEEQFNLFGAERNR